MPPGIAAGYDWRMRRGQEPEAHGGRTWTKAELLEAAGISPGVFDAIRKAARVKGPSHGGLKFRFGEEDVRTLIDRALRPNFSDHGPPAAAAWRALLEGEDEAEASDPEG